MFWSNQAIAAVWCGIVFLMASYAAHAVLTHGRASLARLGPILDITILALAPVPILLALSGAPPIA